MENDALEKVSLITNDKAIQQVAFHPRELIWSAAIGTEVQLFSLRTKEENETIVNAITPPGRRDIYKKENEHYSYYPNTLHKIQDHSRFITCIAFQPKSKYMATSSDDGIVNVYSISPNKGGGLPEIMKPKYTIRHTRHLPGFVDSICVNSMMFHSMKPLLVTVISTTSFDKGHLEKTLYLWRISDDKEPENVATVAGHKDSVMSVAFHASLPYLVTGSADKTVKLWRIVEDNPDINKRLICVSTIETTNGVLCVAFHPSLPIFAASCSNRENTVKFWEISSTHTCDPLTSLELKGHTDTINSFVFHPLGEYILTGSRDNTAKLWQFSTSTHPSCVTTIQFHTGEVKCVAFHPILPYMATCSSDGQAVVWYSPKLSNDRKVYQSLMRREIGLTPRSRLSIKDLKSRRSRSPSARRSRSPSAHRSRSPSAHRSRSPSAHRSRSHSSAKGGSYYRNRKTRRRIRRKYSLVK
jgi:WD40 repeat protein